MRDAIAPLLLREPLNYKGLAFFDLPSSAYESLANGMLDEHRWHFQHNNTETHMEYLRETGPRMVSWSRKLAFPKGSIHLDIGSGEGILSYLVARRGYHSIAVDLCATILHGASLFKSAIDDEHASMELWVANIYDLPLKSGTVDFITIKEVLHHLEDLDGLMREIARILKPNGVVYLLWEPFYISIPILRGWQIKGKSEKELKLGIHHVYHTYWTYRNLFSRWLNEPVFETEFETSKLQHYLTRNVFTSGVVSISGKIKPNNQIVYSGVDRRNIKPEDFLCEDLINDGFDMTKTRKEFLDSLSAAGN